MNQDYSTVIETPKSSNEVFTSISNVQQWWTENFEGESQKLNDEFTVRFGESFIQLKVIELVTNYRIVWEVTDSFKHFLKNKREWVGTRLIFVLVNEDNQKTKLTFTHEGLKSPLECYEICCDAWNGYLQGSLKSLINEGVGNPDRKIMVA